MTMEEIVITAVASVCVFVAVLVFVLRMSSRRPVAVTSSPGGRTRGGWEETSWSFGPDEDDEHGGAPGYGRPPGYGPPPLWTGPPYDPPGWR
jgi:hypothetical protein